MITQDTLFNTLASAWEFYETLNLRLVPCRLVFQNGKKHPSIPKWKDRDFTVKDLRPDDNALAVKTGDASGITVIDIDIRDGIERNEFLNQLNFDLFNYPFAYTPSGGVHIYFKSSSTLREMFNRTNLTTSNHTLGIDIRDNNALIFLPPSHIEGYGTYRWENRPLETGDIFDYDTGIVNLLELIFASENHPPACKGKLPFPEIKPRPVYSPAESYPDYDEEKFERAREIIEGMSHQVIEYCDFVKAGFALRKEFGEAGKPLWDMFLINPNYNDSQEYLDEKWRSFSQVHSINFGSLIYLGGKYEC